MSHFLVASHLKIQEDEAIGLVSNVDKGHETHRALTQQVKCAALSSGINRCSHKDNNN